jgi:hypothetical protein
MIDGISFIFLTIPIIPTFTISLRCLRVVPNDDCSSNLDIQHGADQSSSSCIHTSVLSHVQMSSGEHLSSSAAFPGIICNNIECSLLCRDIS